VFKWPSVAGGLRRWQVRGKGRRTEEEAGQGGFTLVETVVALAVFTVTLVPTTGVFFGGIQAASVSSVRSDAASVAASTLAQVQALPINEVGFYTSQPDYVPSCPSSVPACSGGQTVDLGSTAPSGAFTPVTTQAVGSTTFTITTYITSANASVPSGTTCLNGTESGSDCWQGAYPLVTVVVSWRGPTAGSVTESTIDYPGGLGPWTAPLSDRGGPVTCPSTPAPPVQQSPAAASSPSTSQSAWVDVSWDPVSPQSDEPCYYVIDVTTNEQTLSCTLPSGSGVQASYWQPGTADSYLVTGLSWGTTYYFTVVAYSSGGASCAISNTESFQTATNSTSSTCTATSFSVTAEPSNSSSKTYLDSHGKMTDDLDLVASTTGTCSNLTVASELVGSTTPDPGPPPSPWTLAAGSGGQFTYTVDSIGTAWTTGQHEFTLYIDGTATNEQQSLEVCSFASGQGQKTSSGNSCP
jgi:hypothetical protein